SVFGRWHLERSADMGYSKAIIAFAKVLDSENSERAVEYYLIAAGKGNEEAIERLTQMGISLPEVTSRRRRKTSD
ncbi:MAG: hypothetical protein MJZ38_00605, partial [archaeon]|nr:hypothetical protein [archaeon]